MAFEIEKYIAAGYPAIIVQGAEDQKILEDIKEAVKKINKSRTDVQYSFKYWTVISDWQTDTNNRAIGSGAKSLNDIIETVKAMLAFPKPGVYVLLNFHFFMKAPEIIQSLKDLIYKYKSENRHIIFVENVLTLPPELEKDVIVLDYELPSRDELNSVLDEINKDALGEDRVKVTKALRGKILDAASGMTYMEAENALALSYIETRKFDVSIINREKGQILRKSGLLEYYPAAETMDNVGGLANLKDWLAKRSKAFTAEAKEFGIEIPKGVLLVGPPGVGKSLCGKAIANTWGMPLIRIDIGKAFGKFVGDSENNIRMMTKQLDAMAPAVAWLDEVEKAFSGTTTSGATDSGVTMRVLGTFLTWRQETTKPIFICMTVNNARLLPAELMRKGRVDEIFYLDIPNAEERKEIFKIHIAKRKRDVTKFDLDKLVAASEGYVGSEIEESIKASLFDAFDAGREITTEDIIFTLQHTVPLTITMAEQINYNREWAKDKAKSASIRDNANISESVVTKKTITGKRKMNVDLN